MKVYELMNLLSKMDAGAEVTMCNLLTVEDVKSSGPADIDDGKQYYEVIRALKEVEQDEFRVFLYT